MDITNQKNRKIKKEKRRHRKDKTQKHKRDKTKNLTGSYSDSEHDSPKKRLCSAAFSNENIVDLKKDESKSETSHLSLERDDWMTANSLFLNTYSKSKKNPTDISKVGVYDPKSNSRELNPYWKSGNYSGMPFQKPNNEDIRENKVDLLSNVTEQKNLHYKKHEQREREKKGNKQQIEQGKAVILPQTDNKNLKDCEKVCLTDREMNALGAKIVKAEIMGNTELAKALKKTLENARGQQDRSKEDIEKSFSKRNLMTNQQYINNKNNKSFDSYYRGECSSLNFLNKFKPEKQITQKQLDLEYDELSVEHPKVDKDPRTDLFEDSKQKKLHQIGSETIQRTHNIIDNFRKFTANCDKCLESDRMDKHLIVSMGSNCYLALPWHQGLQPEHCLIVPIHHVSCSTELDENVWSEITNFRKSLTKMFYERKMSVVFFELYKSINQRSHMIIHCIASKNLDLAPLYFKKAIEESESDWSTNKQLISLKDKNLIKSVPKGLPYFWIHFGMENGFAHVIENQEKFPTYFAQEIIGNILNLNPSTWRKPGKEYNTVQKVNQLANWWKHYDCTENNNSHLKYFEGI